MDRDPLVYGPAPSSPELLATSLGVLTAASEGSSKSSEETSNLRLTLRLKESSPGRDLIFLFSKPRQFFKSFQGETNVSNLLVVKAFLGLVVFVWLGEFVSHQGGMVRSISQLLSHLNESYFQYFEERLHVTNLKDKFLGAWIALAQLKMFLAPLISFFAVLFWAASTALVLPFFGVDRKKIPFNSLIVAGAYLQWFQILAIVPVVGSSVAGIVIFVLSIFAVKWIFDVSLGVAFVASHLVSWLALMFAGFLLALTVLAWSALS